MHVYLPTPAKRCPCVWPIMTVDLCFTLYGVCRRIETAFNDAILLVHVNALYTGNRSLKSGGGGDEVVVSLAVFYGCQLNSIT